MKTKTVIKTFIFILAFTTQLNAQKVNYVDVTQFIKEQYSTATDNKLVLISFWSSQNAQSRALNKELYKAYTVYEKAKLKNGKEGVVFLTVSVDEVEKNYNIALSKDSLTTALNYCDYKGVSKESFASKQEVLKTPYAVLFNSKGAIVAENITIENVRKLFSAQVTR